MLIRIVCTVLCTLFMTGFCKTALAETGNDLNGLIEEDGYYHYYENGEMLTDSWKEVDNEKYYFKEDGSAAVLSNKIDGKYYIFDNTGRLMCSDGKKICDIEADGEIKKYYINPDGTAACGWDKSRTYYFYKNGEAAEGIIVLNKKFFYFNSNMKYNRTRTKKIRNSAKYEKPFSNLKKYIGKPNKVKYYESCYGNGKDGILKYENFTVYTFKPKKGKELYMGADGM